jgi:Flp pilus assembly protein TadD
MNQALQSAFAAHQAGNLDSAVAGYRKVLEEDPANGDALNLLGVALRAQGELDEALICVAEAVAVAPGHVDAWYNYGNALCAAGRREEAVAAYGKVIALDPSRATAHANIGVVLSELGRPEEAVASYEAALALSPGHVIARHNIGNLLPEIGRLDDGIQHLREAVRISPELAEAHYNLGLALLRVGDYAAGFSHYEWRFKAPAFTGKRYHTHLPDWTGAPFDGKRILIHTEQGLGDTLQFVRFAPMVRSLGSLVSLQGPKALKRLLGRAAGIDHVYGEADDVSGHQLVVPLMSLPNRLGLTLGSIPRTVPYLSAEPERLKMWQDRLAPDGRRIVGVGWHGNPVAPIDRGRSLPGPELLMALAEAVGIRLVALHKLGAEELVQSQDGTGWRVATAPFLEHPGPGFDAGPDAFLDTAAVMTLADMVVTTDTSLAHLAGALARPTIVMLRHLPDWRWMMTRTDSPWYPTLTLVRQKTPGDWADVVARTAGLVHGRARPAARAA